MANRYGTAVLFSMEKNIWYLSARITFGAAGAPTLDTNNSKGFCNVSLNQVSFTGTTANSSATVSSVSSFAGLYPGMNIVDNFASPSHVNSTISSMTAGAGTITMAGNATGTNTGLIAYGGQYRLQLGQLAATRLDSWYKILGFQIGWDESGAQGDASTLALAPNAPIGFIVGNNTAVRTVPPTAAANLTDCTITFQVGYNQGTSFVAKVPASGEACRVQMIMGNCSAP